MYHKLDIYFNVTFVECLKSCKFLVFYDYEICL